jgi:ShK domain-like
MTLRSRSLVPILLLSLVQWYIGRFDGIRCWATAAVDTVITHQQNDAEGVVCEIDASTGEQVCQGTSESGSVTIDDSSTNDTAVLEEEPPTPDNDSGMSAGAAAVEDNCVDQHESCAFWASVDECTKNPGYMLSSCALSCRSCVNSTIADETTLYGERQLINTNPEFMETFQKMHDYMMHTVFVNESFADVKANVSC